MSETTLKTIHPTTLTIASSRPDTEVTVPVEEAICVPVSPGECHRCGETETIFSVTVRPQLSTFSLEDGVSSEPYPGFATAVGCVRCIETGDRELRLPHYFSADEVELLSDGLGVPGIMPSPTTPGVAWSFRELI